MLYISTRNPRDTYTAYRALHESKAPDGGMFVPFRRTVLSQEELDQITRDSFAETVSKMLNHFFTAHISGWDVECAVGRSPVKLTPLGRRTVTAELWHNLDYRYSCLEQCLYGLLTGRKESPSGWPKVAIRIAVICALVGEMSRSGITTADFAVATGDFSTPIAIWYCREMGLPVGMILCGCNENGLVWDLLHRGECNTGAAVVRTDIPELDIVLPAYLENLIFASQDASEFNNYLEAVACGGTYAPAEENLLKINDGLCASVVGSARVHAVVNSVYRTNDYRIDPVTALVYGALQDYRARTGENRMTILVSDSHVKHYKDTADF